MCAMFRVCHWKHSDSKTHIYPWNVMHPTKTSNLTDFDRKKKKENRIHSGQFGNMSEKKSIFFQHKKNWTCCHKKSNFSSKDLNSAGGFQWYICVWFGNHTERGCDVYMAYFTSLSKLRKSLLWRKENILRQVILLIDDVLVSLLFKSMFFCLVNNQKYWQGNVGNSEWNKSRKITRFSSSC